MGKLILVIGGRLRPLFFGYRNDATRISSLACNLIPKLRIHQNKSLTFRLKTRFIIFLNKPRAHYRLRYFFFNK